MSIRPRFDSSFSRSILRWNKAVRLAATQPRRQFILHSPSGNGRPSALSIHLLHNNAMQSRHSSSTASSPPSGTSRSIRPLDGITVVSLEQAVSAPYCTRQLAELGARVIKVERPRVGDFARDYDKRAGGLCSHFVWINRSKESLALDLKQPKDIAVLRKLLGSADVFVQNLAPGASDRLGLSYETLRSKNPRLIVCDISGYGQDGPYRNKKAYDLLIQSEAGVLSTTGKPNEPAKVGISIADISAGMYAYSNILAALMQRGKTGHGCKIDISMLECMVEWMGFPLYYTYKDAPPPVPAGASHASIFPYGPFQTGDGKSVMLGIQNEREWVNLCKDVLGDEGLATDPRFSENSLRSENRQELTQIIKEAFSDLTVEQTVERLDNAKIANAIVNDMQGVWRHEQLRARRRWSEVGTPMGPLPALIPPGFTPDGIEEGIKGRMDSVPAVGEHNESILAELGMSESAST